eukprot:7262-Pelagococcus_subviridis.AAC.1
MDPRPSEARVSRHGPDDREGADVRRERDVPGPRHERGREVLPRGRRGVREHEGRAVDEVRSISHRSPYDPARVVLADP